MCLTPINLKKEKVIQKLKDTYHMQQVPCGRCLECLKLRVNQWYVRIKSELDVSDNAYFVTFTYDDDNLPYSDNGLMSLDYTHFQKFIRSVRKYHNEKNIRYFCVGEYGSRTHRPHYHAIMFNVTNIDNLTRCWSHGSTHVGKVEDASIFYTLKYALKRAEKWRKKADPDNDRAVEKSLISKGIGLNYLTEAMVKYHKDDVSRPTVFLGNKKLPMPRYYRDKIFTDLDKKIRNKKLEPFMAERYEKTSSKLFPQRFAKMLADQEEKNKKTD